MSALYAEYAPRQSDKSAPTPHMSGPERI